MKVDLGTTDKGPEEFDLYVDRVHNDQVPSDKFLQADLDRDWPLKDNSVDLLRAFDFIEHLRDRIHTMNEAWRILKAGGIFHILVPTTSGAGAWSDPTHVSFWNRATFDYFIEGTPERKRFADHYRIKACFRVKNENSGHRFQAYECEKLKITFLEIELEAVKRIA